MSRWLPAGDVLRMNAMLYPDKMGAKDLARSMSFKVWNDRSCRLANAILGLGLQKGDRIAVLAYNCVEWMEIYAAVAKAGLVVVPIMFRLAGPEISYICENSESKAFIVAKEFADTVDGIRGDLAIPDANYIFFGGEKAPAGYQHYEGLIAGASNAEPDVKVNHEDPWTIMYTSGTTGKPKGVVRSHESYIAQYLINEVEFGFNKDDIGLLVMPMCHVNSIFYSFVFTYCGGGVCVYSKLSFDPENLLKVISDERITYTSLVPTHFIMIQSLADEVKAKYDVSCISKLMCSSAPAREDTKLWILDFFNNTKLFEAYGSTEAGLVTLLHPEDQLKKLGSIGREVIGTDRIRLLDEDRNEVPDGEVAELFSRTPMVFNEYWKMPEKTKDSFVGEYFSAGDMAYRDEDGFYHLVDRKNNMIITGGENVFPSEVQNVIGKMDAVKDVAVIGIPHEKWGEALQAVVILNEGKTVTDKEIVEFCRGKIAGYKIPKSIDFIKDEEMPRTATGKILHRKLREKYGTWSQKK